MYTELEIIIKYTEYVLHSSVLHIYYCTIIITRLYCTYLFSGWQHGCIMPFMSKYKLSNSTPFGFGWLESIGITCPLTSCAYMNVKIMVHIEVVAYSIRHKQVAYFCILPKGSDNIQVINKSFAWNLKNVSLPYTKPPFLYV